MLSLDGLSVGLVQGVSLQVAPGEILCISGESGSGKTRLLRAIADLDPHSGMASIGGDARSAVSAHRWRRWVMLVPTESSWWGDTVREHLPDPVPGSLAAFGFDEAVLEWPVSRLSSGEKQRLAVLRALARRPRALLLDEPTANLDAGLVHGVENWLRDYARREGLPLVWAAHDRAQIDRVADRHFVICGNRLEEWPCSRN